MSNLVRQLKVFPTVWCPKMLTKFMWMLVLLAAAGGDIPPPQ